MVIVVCEQPSSWRGRRVYLEYSSVVVHGIRSEFSRRVVCGNVRVIYLVLDRLGAHIRHVECLRGIVLQVVLRCGERLDAVEGLFVQPSVLGRKIGMGIASDIDAGIPLILLVEIKVVGECPENGIYLSRSEGCHPAVGIDVYLRLIIVVHHLKVAGDSPRFVHPNVHPYLTRFLNALVVLIFAVAYFPGLQLESRRPRLGFRAVVRERDDAYP